MFLFVTLIKFNILSFFNVSESYFDECKVNGKKINEIFYNYLLSQPQNPKTNDKLVHTINPILIAL
jgi:hypothetical protein